jgi:rubrerythrin
MLRQRTITTRDVVQGDNAAVLEAMRLLSGNTAPRRWTCEVCGMIHTGAADHTCDSCGASSSLVEYDDLPREINSRW